MRIIIIIRNVDVEGEGKRLKPRKAGVELERMGLYTPLISYVYPCN